MTTPPLLHATGLYKSFTTDHVTTTVIENLDIDLYTGEFALLMGPSGSGKSTLLAAISGLQCPDRGKVIVDGQDLWGVKGRDISRFRLDYCGFIFQNVNLFTCLTAIEQVMFMLEQTGVKGGEARKIAERSLAEVGLENKASLRPTDLSGGEKQRVAIARTLAMEPKIIFADEPTSNLDSHNGQMVVDLLHEATRTHGSTVLCVTHDERVKSAADRILTIEDGVIRSDTGRDKKIEVPRI